MSLSTRSRFLVSTLTALTSLSALSVLTPAAAHAQALPFSSSLPGLNPGDIYQFVFVTSGTTAAMTSGAAYYNNFVQTAANTAGIGSTIGVTWTALVSTGTQASPVRANTNAPVASTTKVYLITGGEVANGGTNSFYSSVDHLLAINVTENSTTVNRNVWTGSNATGSESGSGLVGNAANPVAGYSGGTIAANSDPGGNSWARVGNPAPASTLYSLYAVSNTFVAANAAPEPGSAALLCFGFLSATGGVLRASRQRRLASRNPAPNV